MKKGAIYARYSSEKQSGESIKVQVDKCREYCERHDIVVVEEFIDEAKTGTTEGGREEYARILEMASKGQFDTVVAYKFDRIGRSLADNARLVQVLGYHGVTMSSATEANDPFARNIAFSMAEEFSRQHGARMHDTMSSNAAQGFHCGGAAPYGYVSVETPEPSGRTDHKGNPIKHVIFDVNPEQAEVVQGIFRDYAEGISMKKIAHAMNHRGILSPGGSTWDISAVRYILHNEAYRGWRIWNKTEKVRKPDGKKTYRHRPRSEWVIVKDAHPAIVDDQLWEAGEKAKIHRAKYRARKGGNRTPFSDYLLTGLIKCAECGGNYIVHCVKDGRYFYYRCSYHERRGNSVCANNTTITRDRLETAVLDLMQREILTKSTVQMLIEDVRTAWKTQKKDDGEHRMQKELQKVAKELVNLVQAIKTTGISEALRSELTLCETRKEELQRQLLALRSSPQKTDRLPTEKEIKAALNGFRSVLESGTQQERAALLEENIEEIVVEPTGDVLLKANPKGFFPYIFHYVGAEGRTRTGTTDNGQRILSPSRLPIPPPRHDQSDIKMEATPGLEPGNKGFAGPCLTTWPRRLVQKLPRF